MCTEELQTIEKIGEYKKEMKRLVKGLIKSKLFQTEDGDLTITIEKCYDKDANKRVAKLKAANGAFKACLTFDVSTRVYNKIDPTLFETLGEQLSRTKNFGKLFVK